VTQEKQLINGPDLWIYEKTRLLQAAKSTLELWIVKFFIISRILMQASESPFENYNVQVKGNLIVCPQICTVARV